MTANVRPIHPLTIPQARASALWGEAQDCAEPPAAPGLPPSDVFPGVKAYAIGQGDPTWALQPYAYALFVPDEYVARTYGTRSANGRIGCRSDDSTAPHPGHARVR